MKLSGMAIDLAIKENERGPVSAPHASEPSAQAGWFVAVGRAMLPLALVGLASVTPFVGSDAAVLEGVAALTLLSAVIGHHGCARLGVGLTATLAASAFLPWQVGWWPVPGVVGVGVYLVSLAVPTGEPGRRRAILGLGRLTMAEAWMVAGLVVSSGSVLVMFSRLAPPRLGDGASLLTGLTPWSLVAAGAAFAVVNAFVEEVLFRGAVLYHLGRVLGSGPAVLVQALAFGMLHLNGYPYGLVGAALASVYGVMLGALRVWSGGLLAPWIAHVCADVVIFVLIVQAAT